MTRKHKCRANLPFKDAVEKYPYISFLIPTYNAATYLRLCLESIQALDYPKNRIEVLIADGGSSDKTICIAKELGAFIFKNKRMVAEFGKRKAFDKSIGEFIVFLDSDNVIASKDWLTKMLIPFNNRDVIGVESNYLISPNFTSINTYANLLVIVDPLARMLASKPTIVLRESYLVKRYVKGSVPVCGANGFIWRRGALAEYARSHDELNEVAIMAAINKKCDVYIANIPGTGIYHYYCNSLNDYVHKRVKIARKHLARSYDNNTWVDSRGKVRMVLYSLYLCTFIGPLAESLAGLCSQKRIEWLWHPPISCLTILIYLREYLVSFFSRLTKTFRVNYRFPPTFNL